VTFWDSTQHKFAEAGLAKQSNNLAKTNRELQGQIAERKLVSQKSPLHLSHFDIKKIG